MAAVVHYKGRKPVKVPMSNLSKLIALFAEHGLTEQFHQAMSRSRLSLDPLLAMMLDRGIDTQGLNPGNLSIGNALEGIQVITALPLDQTFRASLEDTYIEMTPALINSMKDFIGSNNLMARSPVAARAAGACQTPVPYTCPKWF